MKKICAIVFFVSGLFLSASECIKNGSFEDSEVKDYFLSQGDKYVTESLYIENLTWNKCLRLELNELKNDEVGVNILFGKSEKKTGFIAKPDCTYEFSFEMKGTVPNAGACALLFHNEDPWWKSNQRITTSLSSVKVAEEWTKYSGTFRTGSDTKRAAFSLQLWANKVLLERNSWKQGQFLLIDNISVRERSELFETESPLDKKIDPIPVLLAPTTDTYFGERFPFAIDYDHEKITVCTTLPPSETKKSVSVNGKSVWADTVVEVFFGPATEDRVLSQFVLASGGGRYMGNGMHELENYDDWTGKVSGQTYTFEIPWKTIGAASGPVRSIAFNIGAQFGGKAFYLPPLKKNFHDVQNYNLLIFGKLSDYLKEQFPGSEKFADLPASEAVVYMQQMKQAAQWEEFSKRPFLAARFPVTHGFSLPLEISKKELITEPIELTALVNEHKVLPFAIANRSKKSETYRIVVRNTDPKEEIDDNGLDHGFTSITLREALIVKDSDAPEAGRIFDPLPKMNEAQTLTIPSGEVGLVWISFDCTSPGSYTGLIRVIPLSEPALVKRHQYIGEMRDYPLSLNVLPYILEPVRAQGSWAKSYVTKSLFKLHQELAPSELMVCTWSLSFRFDEKGNVINQLPDLAKKIRSWHGLFKQFDSNPKLKFAIGYSAYDIMVRAHLNKAIQADSPECVHAFKNYLRACDALMREAGVPEEEYAFELFDEPRGENFDRDLAVAKAAREALPTGNLLITWPPRNFAYTPDMIRQFMPYVNYHLFHHLLLPDPEFMKVIEEVKQTPGSHYGYYVCSTSMRESLHRYYRLVGWKGLQTAAEFYHIYTFCEGPWGTLGATNWKAAAKGGLALRAGDLAIPTIRSEAAREGFTDVQYLELLNDPEFIRKAVKEVVEEASHDPRIPDQIRSKVIQRLKEK